MFGDTSTSLVGGARPRSRKRAWTRTSEALPFCAVESINSHEHVVNRCLSRWPIADVYEIHDSPSEDEACVSCLRMLLAIRMTELGLCELEEVTRGS